MSRRDTAAPRDRKQEIYDAAVDLFWQRGYFGTSMRDLASAVGVQTSSLYHHNSTKQVLLVEIMERTMSRLTAEVSEAVEGAEGTAEQLAEGVRAHVLFHGRHPRDAFVTDFEIRALEPDNRERIIAMRDRHQAIFEGLIARGTEQGIFDASDVKTATYAIATMSTAVSTWYRAGGRLPIEEIAREYAGFALGIVRGCPVET
ncbi:MAG: TetR/AcrR family transcriptional regulator [Actinomycetota bacterium]